MIKPKNYSKGFTRAHICHRKTKLEHRQTNTQSLRHRKKTNNTRDSCPTIRPLSLNITIRQSSFTGLIEVEGALEGAVEGLRLPCRGDDGDAVVLHVEQGVGCAHHGEGDKGERETTC